MVATIRGGGHTGHYGNSEDAKGRAVGPWPLTYRFEVKAEIHYALG
jgi:hypothetical protein